MTDAATEFCSELNWVLWLAMAFLAASLLLGAASVAKALWATPRPSDARDDDQPIGPILEAFKGLIEALGKTPAWFALFLAGLFLFWLAGKTYVDACKPPPPCPEQCPQSSAPPNARPQGTQPVPVRPAAAPPAKQ